MKDRSARSRSARRPPGRLRRQPPAGTDPRHHRVLRHGGRGARARPGRLQAGREVRRRLLVGSARQARAAPARGRGDTRLRAALDRRPPRVAVRRARGARLADGAEPELRGRRSRAHGPRHPALRRRDAEDRQRADDELDGRPVPEPRLGAEGASRPRARGGARQALGRDRAHPAARRRRSGRRVARADARRSSRARSG